MGETGALCVSRVLIRVRSRVLFGVVWKERKRSVLLCVGLHKESQRAFGSFLPNRQTRTEAPQEALLCFHTLPPTLLQRVSKRSWTLVV